MIFIFRFVHVNTFQSQRHGCTSIIDCVSVCHILLLDPQLSPKGSYKFSFVRPFIRNADISGSACQKFLIFCTKLEQHKCRKVSFSNFRKKLLTPCGWGQKVKFGPKLLLFQRLLPNCMPESFDFCMKLDNNKAFQTMYILSSGNSCLGPPGVKRSNFGPKIDFFKNIS